MKDTLLRLQALFLAGVRLERTLDDIKINQGRLLALGNAAQGHANLQDHEFKVFSQWGEDGILQHLVSVVPIEQRTFIEFGVEDFRESNCRFLLMKDLWRGYVIDGSPKNSARLRASYYYWKYPLESKSAFITRDNVDALMADSGFDPDLGILSIDVDGVDYWLLEAISCVRPRILVMEYNAMFGPERAITVPYAGDFSRGARHFSWLYFGASLAALDHLARRKGYVLVGTNSAGCNAFFVRADLMSDRLRPLTVAEAFTPACFRESRDERGRLDYRDAARGLERIRGLPVVNVVSGSQEPL